MKPLTGVRILSLAGKLPGPAAVAELVRYGATVVKVEPPFGDPLSEAPEFYELLTKGQTIVQLDLKAPADRAKLDEYLADADLLITSHLPSSLARMQLDWTDLHARWPRLCQVAIIGYAPPDEEVTGHDLSYLAKVGLVQPPNFPPTPWADMSGALWTICQSLAVLRERDRTGEGVHVYVPLADAVEWMAQPRRYGLSMPGARLGGGLARYQIYPTADGYLAVAALEPQLWKKMLSLLNLEDATQEQLAKIMLTRTAAEWERWADEHRLPLAAVRMSLRG